MGPRLKAFKLAENECGINYCTVLNYEMSQCMRFPTMWYAISKAECLSLKGGCTGSSESTYVKMPHCWKSHATAHLYWQRMSVGINHCIVLNCDIKMVFRTIRKNS